MQFTTDLLFRGWVYLQEDAVSLAWEDLSLSPTPPLISLLQLATLSRVALLHQDPPLCLPALESADDGLNLYKP